MTREELKDYLSANEYPPSKFFRRKVNAHILRSIHEHTNFLDNIKQLDKISSRLYCIVNDIYKLPKCKICENEVTIIRQGGDYSGPYKSGQVNEVCSNSCSVQLAAAIKRNDPSFVHHTQDPAWQKKRAREYMKKHGVSHHTQFGDWGARLASSQPDGQHWTKREDWWDEQCAKIYEKYGVKYHIARADVIEKKESTYLARYGTTTPLAHNHIVKAKADNTKKQKYGSDKFKSSIFYQMSIANDIIDEELSKPENTQHHKLRHIPQSTIDLLSNKEALEEYYEENRHLTCAEIGEKLGVSSSYVIGALKNKGIEVNRSHTRSAAEREICSFLDYHGIDYRTNTRQVIAPRELDIYIPEHNLAIEYNGLFHHRDDVRGKFFHQEKSIECRKHGIKLLHVYEHHWEDFRTNDILKEKILRGCGKSTKSRIYARKCSIGIPIDNEELRDFYETNHIQGYKTCSITYALYHANKLVACIGFRKYKSGVMLERYATSCNVIGGFGKLLKTFIANHGDEFDGITTFANLDYGYGDLYIKTGFDEVGITPPNYYYFKYNQIYSRYQAMKHKLPNILGDGFDENKTEYQNMKDNKFNRYFNSGSVKYYMSL